MSPMSGPSHSRTADWDDDVSSMNGSMGSRSAASAGGSKNKYMVIKRLIRFENGQTEWRSEIVRDPKVINAYVRQRQLIDTQEAGLEQFEPTDKAHENERRKRKLEAQIRKLREAQERKAARKAAREAKDAGKGKKRKELKCSACGEPGHIKTNKVCPKFQLLDVPIEETVKVEGTKISINKAVLQRIGSTPPIGKRKRDDDDTDDFEYSMPFSVRSSRRRHADVELSDYFEKILVDVIGMPESFPFRVPVSIKQHPDYYTLIKTPKDLSMIREDNKNLLYRTAASFLAEFDLIIANCEAYNGQDHYLTGIARSIGEKVARELKDNESYISRLESEIVKELELTTQPTTANASPSSFSLSQDFQSQSLQSNSTITPPSIGNAHSGDGTSNGNIEAGAPHGVPVATSNRNPVTMDMSMSEDEINVMD
ncbi:hypothetical protein BKA69DRAFT_1060401 [Paraphysoderma sedebokerense]|nr:hypothetical protein BKA69DRAFT_1060401 [Paraphysoderma sedebokerense]